MKSSIEKIKELVAKKQSFMVTCNSTKGSELFVIEGKIPYKKARKFIGGFITEIEHPIAKSEDYTLLVNDNGMFEHLEPNDFATMLIDVKTNWGYPIVGNAIVAFGNVIE